MATVPHKMIGLERMSEYGQVRLLKFYCICVLGSVPYMHTVCSVGVTNYRVIHVRNIITIAGIK